VGISVVQSAKAAGASVSFASPTTAGNCVVVCVTDGANITGTISVTAVTLGGSAGNFASAAAVGGASNGQLAAIWTDQNCAGGKTAVAATVSNSKDPEIFAYEISGLLTSSAVDKTSTGNSLSNAAAWSSGSTATTAQATEIWIGCMSTRYGQTVTPPGAYTSQGQSGSGTNQGYAGYEVVSSTGTAVYNGTVSPSSPYAAAVVTLKGTTNVVVSLPVAQVTVAALAPSPIVGVTLPVAQVTITAPVPAVVSGKFVAPPTAQVNITAPVPSVPLYLPAAQVNVTAPAPAPTLPPAGVVNQWAATFTQPGSFGPTPPALQSTVITLNSSTSVGGGSGIPTPGNWLFCLAGWNQDGLPGVAAGNCDDIHSYWRPGKISQKGSANTRASIWYTPNLARVAGDVYCAPDGAVAGMACLVVEMSGLGPWDTVTGVSAAYSAAATSLNLALPAPAAAAFVIACVCGDSTAAGQAFAPAGWSALATVSASDGTGHTCDTVLTSACKPSTSGSVSVNATASSATDLAGVIIGVEVAGASPITGTGITPAWPGRMILEAGFGSGLETPVDEITWTTLSDSGVAPGSQVKRFWGWTDQSGVPYTLGQLQSSTGTVQLDNSDGYLTPSNSASPYFPDCITGVPVRLRAALGTIGGVTVNRWYAFSRNALEWPEKRNDAWRNFVELATTDVWSAASVSCPSPYRGEVTQDDPQSWWPLDDQPLVRGTLPTSMLNAAPGNTTVLDVIASPNGTGPTTSFGTDGYNFSTINYAYGLHAGIATYTVAADQGFLYGDPQSSPASSATGNPVTASPGSAAWQMSGITGNTGTTGWFLSARNASYPDISTGITVEGWFKYQFFGSTTSAKSGNVAVIAQQPYCPLTLIDLTTDTGPVAILQLDISGHLNLITYHSGTPASHSIYTASDLRSNSWFMVTMTLTSSGYQVWVNGGATADVSGSATISPTAWTWFIANADMGSASGAATGSVQHSGNVSISHLAVYPSALPAWRVRGHYWAAIAGFGLLPAPSGVTLTPVQVTTSSPPPVTPDGLFMQASGGYGTTSPRFSVYVYTMSAVVVAQAGGYNSGPSAWTATGSLPGASISGEGDNINVAWTGVAPSFAIYTATQAGSETQAAVTASDSDDFQYGYGSGASSYGIGNIAGGNGSAVPAASPAGDTVGERLERIMGYGKMTYPNRAIDPAPLAVQAALDVGGQQAGGNLQNIVSSDNGLLTVDANGTLCYRQKSHLASDTVVWNLSSAGPAYGYPFQPGQEFTTDPQRVVNVIAISQYSPDGATLPLTTPADATAANTSQAQYGPRPLGSATSYLQSSSEIQSQADWYLTQFGAAHRRVTTLTVDAAGYPAAWVLVMNVNPGDLCQVTDQPMLGGPLSVGTYRVSSVSRKIFFGANQRKPEASVELVLDFEPTSWWS